MLLSQFVGKLRGARIQNISEAARVTLYESSPSQKYKIHTVPLFRVAITANAIAEYCGETRTQDKGKKVELNSENFHSNISLQIR